MDDTLHNHASDPLALRFRISLDLYLDGLLSSPHAAQHSIHIDLAHGFHLAITLLTHSLTPAPSWTLAGFQEYDASLEEQYEVGIYGLLPSAVELLLSPPNPPNALEEGLTNAHHGLKSLHFFEIHCDAATLHQSRAIEGPDLFSNGASFLLDTEQILSPQIRTFEISLSRDPLQSLISSRSLDLDTRQPLRQPFGRATLLQVLRSASVTADVEYVETPSTRSANVPGSSKDHAICSHTAAMSAGLSTVDSSHRLHRVGAHRAIMRQWPAFALLLQNFTRPGDDPIVHKLIGIDPEIMQLIVNFIYLGQIEGPGYTGIVDWRRLFQLAHRFQIAPLAEIAMENMCKEIRVQDALPTLFLWAYQHPDYEERLLAFALEYGKNVSASSLHAALEPYRDHPQFLRIYSRLCASHSDF